MTKKNTIKHNTVKMTVRDFLKLRVFVDERFQRNACWTQKDMKKFLVALANGRSLTPMIHADIIACKNFCKNAALVSEKNNNVSKLKLFNAAVQRFNDIWETRNDTQGRPNPNRTSVDGQNRGVAITGYANDEFSCDAYSSGRGSKTFSQLTPAEKDTFLDSEINVTTILSATHVDLTQIFQDVNSGLPLNRMEIRNAISSPMASFVRELAGVYFEQDLEIHKPRLLNNLASITTTRMKDRDTILKTICFVHDEPLNGEHYPKAVINGQHQNSFSDNELDKFYNFGDKSSHVSCYGKDFETKARDMLEFLEAAVLSNKNKNGQPQEVTLPLYWALCGVYSKMATHFPNLALLLAHPQNVTKQHSIFFDLVQEAHADAEVASHQKIANLKNTGHNASTRKKEYYCYYSTDVKDAQKRQKVLNEIQPQIENAALKRLRSMSHQSNQVVA